MTKYVTKEEFIKHIIESEWKAGYYVEVYNSSTCLIAEYEIKEE